MSVVLLSSTSFEGTLIATLDVAGSPAWPAAQIATALGYAPLRFQSRLTTEWSSLFVPEHDYTVLVGADLEAVRAVAPDAVPADAKGAVVLFESGLLVALAKVQAECGPRLRAHLLAQVPAYDARVTTELDLRVSREQRLAGVLDFLDRKMRSTVLRTTAIDLHTGGFVDAERFRALLVHACEIALGITLPELDPTDDWSTVAQIAERTGASEGVVLSTAHALRLLEPHPGEVRPFPTWSRKAWRLSFAFSPSATARIEALVANRVVDRATLTAA